MSPTPGRGRSPKRANSQSRLRIAMILVMAVVSVFGARLMQLQGVDPQAYAARAQADGLRSISLPAKRGEITDRDGEALATSVDGLMLIGDPEWTAPKGAKIARVLAKRLGVDYFDTLAKLTKKNSRFVYLARRVPSTKAKAVLAELDKAKLKGVYSEPDALRNYPAKDVGANLVGFLGDRDAKGNERPLAGLEAAFNKRLAGTDGAETYEVGRWGQRIPLGSNSLTPPKNGKPLSLTIDREVQWYVNRVLRNAKNRARADSASAVVMNTQTGEILALGDYPTFDANAPSKSKKGDLGSRAVSDVFEPGSVSKVLSISALLNEGKVSPSTKVSVPNELPVQDRVIHDWFDHEKLHLTMAGVIAKSSNIGTVISTEQLKRQQLHDYLTKFGLGSKPNLGLAGESRGLVPPWETWGPVNQATISFGQGISVTTVQMAAAINAVANSGEYVSPSLIKGTAVTDSGNTVGTDTAKRHRVISKKAAREMAEMMEGVTNPETGTAPGAQILGYRVAGKTGTAQRVGKNCGCYDGTFTISFAGFAPADDPRFTVYVVLQNPRNGGGGGSEGAPAFNKITNYLLSRYGVPPTGSKPANLPIEW